MAIEDPAPAAVDDGGGGLGNGGMEEELMLARRMAYAASSKGELLRVIRVRTSAHHKWKDRAGGFHLPPPTHTALSLEALCSHYYFTGTRNTSL
jgi:hypothetical protein